MSPFLICQCSICELRTGIPDQVEGVARSHYVRSEETGVLQNNRKTG